MSIKVAWLTAEFKDGVLGNASEPRIGEPSRALQATGDYDCLVTPNYSIHPNGYYFARPYATMDRQWCDIFVLQRVMRDHHADRVARAVEQGQTILVECDDWYWGIPWYNAALEGTHPKRDLEVNRDHYLDIMRAATGVVTSTPYLAHRLADQGIDNIHICRNAVDVDRFAATFTNNVTHTFEAGEHPTIGWRGGVPWRYGDLLELKGIIGRFLERHDLTMIHGGHGTVKGLQLVNMSQPLGIDDDLVVKRPATGYAGFPDLIRDFDIGVIPLVDNPFNKAKSCLAGMEYAAAGVPFIASDTPEYRWLADQYGIGRVAKNPAQWKRHLKELLDPEVRVQEAYSNHHRVSALDISRMVDQWDQTFRKVHDRVAV